MKTDRECPAPLGITLARYQITLARYQIVTAQGASPRLPGR